MQGTLNQVVDGLLKGDEAIWLMIKFLQDEVAKRKKASWMMLPNYTWLCYTLGTTHWYSGDISVMMYAGELMPSPHGRDSRPKQRDNSNPLMWMMKQGQNSIDSSTRTIIFMKGLYVCGVSMVGHNFMVLVDTSVEINYTSLDTASMLGLSWMLAKGHFKGINGEWTSLKGEAMSVPVQMGQWTSTTTFSIALLDDYSIVLGMNFIDYLESIMVPRKDPCVINFGHKRELNSHQINKGIQQAKVLEELKDIMPDDLSKELPPRWKEDHTIEPVNGAEPISQPLYRMSPIKLEEFRKQIKELLEAKFI
ncbi:hypothetical protein RJ641_008925 [Dillenia turbinata]|uniref:Uncharacterized protein n=1 Tax=Dillenia turbinata TaxID=194707 RepID=A0AAN8Z311_9MAGN